MSEGEQEDQDRCRGHPQEDALHRVRDAGEHDLSTAGGRLVTVVGSSDALLTFPPADAGTPFIASVSCRAKTAPNAATPSEPPICWKNIRALDWPRPCP